VATRNSIFIVAGRLGKNLIVSKTLPVIASGFFSHIYIFSEEVGKDLTGAEYIILPAFVRGLRPVLLKKIIRIIYEPLQLIFYAWRLRPAIIHGYYSLPKGLNSLIASKLSRSRCVISIIGGKEEIDTSFFIKRFSRPLIIWLLKKSDYITTKGRKDNEYLLRFGVKEEKICIFNGAIDTGRFCYHGEDKDIDILFAGYFDEFKGPQRALEIIQRVSKELPDIRTLFIGDGPLYQSIQDKTINLGLSKNITFAGYVDDSENYFKRSHILIFPSANEGLSTAMLEAMACRCVPITSDVGNQTEAALHEYNSIVITDYNDVQSFSEQAIRLLRNRRLKDRLAENSERTILSKYTPDSQGMICQRFYSLLTNGKTFPVLNEF
jgi:glycosyltransferase involved in cell wall biosynthesis